MNSHIIRNLGSVLITLFLILLTRMAGGLPWWSFVVPVFLFGMISKLLRWELPGFFIGSLGGFIIWFGTNLYYDIIYQGIVLDKMAAVLSVPKMIILLGSGLIGGLLSGLALYTGRSVIEHK